MSRWNLLTYAAFALAFLTTGIAPVFALNSDDVAPERRAAYEATMARKAQRPTTAQRLTAAAAQASALSVRPQQMPGPGGKPNYFGPEGNWTNSPIIRKFVDLLPGLGAGNANNLGQYLPIAVPDTTTYAGCDYYEIELRRFTEKVHSDLPPTRFQGYVQVKNGVDVSPPHYLGPTIIAKKGRPVRIKFTNKLPTGAGGNLFLPVDTTVMGSGMGPEPMMAYTQNRATLHLHGGLTPWISDGTPHQWTTPAGEMTPYPRGVSVYNVPDMPEPGPGSLTFFYSNEQSARLMFYHDHAYGITRLNVYAGEAAPYVLRDPTENSLIAAGVIPADEIPLIIQDKTFVPNAPKLTATDPTWDTAKWGGPGSLWYPHVYMPNQNPNALDGANPVGRFDYGPWFWPIWPVNNPPVRVNGVWQPTLPNISMVMEAFMDTPMVNGTAYPICRVQRKAYRFRILNACNDRFLNLGIYYAASNTPDSVDAGTGLPTLQTLSGEVPTVPLVSGPVWPPTWGTPDGRDGGVPDPASFGPPFIQIGTEGGFLPAPVVIPCTPIFYDLDRRSATVLNVKEHGLFLGAAERADVIVDFSGVPDGSRLILYNDSPAPVPAGDSRLDYYTGNEDYTGIGGAPSTVAGYGPNTRTIMQFEVSGPAAPAFKMGALKAAFASTATAKGVFAASQDPILVPQPGYNTAYNKAFPGGFQAYERINSTQLTFTPLGASQPLTILNTNKAIAEEFENEYGRMASFLGVEMPFSNGMNQTTIFYSYIDPPNDIVVDNITPAAPQPGDGTQIWKITHNGVDTHAIHFHLFNVQIVNRVGWDNVVKPPDPNELGWKETVRMNPLEDCIVALRPVAPKMPFGVPTSKRAYDVTSALGTTGQFKNVDIFGNPGVVINQVADFGWEYVWHCHLLAHEEMDMMRPIVFQVTTQAPAAPVLSGGRNATRVALTWTDATPAATSWGNPKNEVGFRVLRSANNGPWLTIARPLANQTTYQDSAISLGTSYRYRVVAWNASGEAVSNTKTF